MTAEPRIRGVLAPVLTPFSADLRPDASRLVRLCRWLLAQDVGLAVFGTTSEANSMSVFEKSELLDALLEAGIPPQRMMPGTGCCAGVLMLPPFYYKGVSDDGLFASYAEVVERVGDPRLRIYLYHIPPVSQVPISLALIERLLERYPQTIAGAKDSSGDFNNMRAMMERFGSSGFDVFSGNESFLLGILRGGGAGCISASANVNAPAISRLAREWQSANADAQQSSLDRVRAVFQRFPVIPALKAAVAHFVNDETWARLRPPLCALTTAQRDECIKALRAIGFEMRGLQAARAQSQAIVSS